MGVRPNPKGKQNLHTIGSMPPEKFAATSSKPVGFDPVKLLFIGDVVGEPGRRAVKVLVPRIREQSHIDCVVANGENSAGGSGITAEIASEFFASGVDVLTSGDHIWDQKETVAYIDQEPRLLRPANYPAGTPGNGSTLHQLEDGRIVGVINVQGRTFMASLENPFRVLEAEINKLQSYTRVIFVDVHAEATSEKIALARMVDGKVSAVIGTHTHVQTADEQIFPGGTAFLCDAGFTGPHESVLGREIEPVIRRFTTGLPQRFPVARDRVLLQGAVVEVDESSGRAISISRLSMPLDKKA